MKNLYGPNGKILPVSIAKSEFEDQLKKAAFESYEKGLDAAIDCLEQAFKTAKDKGHEMISLDHLIELTAELRKIAKKNLPK